MTPLEESAARAREIAAVRGQVEVLQAEVQAEVQALREARLAKDSPNNSKPSSSDGLGPIWPRGVTALFDWPSCMAWWPAA